MRGVLVPEEDILSCLAIHRVHILGARPVGILPPSPWGQSWAAPSRPSGSPLPALKDWGQKVASQRRLGHPLLPKGPTAGPLAGKEGGPPPGLFCAEAGRRGGGGGVFLASVSSRFTFLSVLVLLPAANEAGLPLWTRTRKPKHGSTTILGAAEGGEWPAAPPHLPLWGPDWQRSQHCPPVPLPAWVFGGGGGG